MPDEPMIAGSHAPVEAMAKALSAAETAIEQAMIRTGALPAAIRDFHYAIGSHTTYQPYSDAGAAQNALGQAMDFVSACHKRLDAIRKVHKLPDPSDAARNGGGGSKP